MIKVIQNIIKKIFGNNEDLHADEVCNVMSYRMIYHDDFETNCYYWYDSHRSYEYWDYYDKY